MNVFNLQRTFKMKKDRGWKTIYISIDLHGTIIYPYHYCIEFYPGSIEVLQWMTKRKDFKIILWTSSYTKEVVEMVRICKSQNITLDFCNRNPLEQSTDKADFSSKFYFNVLLDDKAGMEPESDWFLIKDELQRLGEWDKIS